MLQLMFDIPTLLIFVVVFCLVLAYKNACKPNNFPPGPPVALFRGNLPLISGNKRLHKTFAELRQKYGSIVGIQLGWYPAVIISDAEILREAFVTHGDKFSNRPNHILMTRLLAGNAGLINGHGDMWKAAKRLALRAFRDLGVGKTIIEDKVMDEANAILGEIGKNRGKPFQFGSLFAKASCNLIISTLFGCRYEYKDPELNNLLGNLEFIMKLGGIQNGYAFLMPPLLPALFLNYQMLTGLSHWSNLGSYLKKQIKDHQESFDPANIRDFVDVYIEAEKENKDNTAYTPKNIFLTIIDLFIAGTETTSTTLQWAMLYMLKYPDIQQRCRKEILQVVGSNRVVSLKNRSEMPFVEATICEVQRLGNIAPHAVLHTTSGSIEFHGYSFPDKTIIVPDLYSIHMDPDKWNEPEEFKPERFLDEEGQVVKQPHFMPFSIGRRSCPGENLARTELFMFFTSLLQNYTFTTTDVNKLPGLKDGQMGITLYPPPYDIIANPL